MKKYIISILLALLLVYAAIAATQITPYDATAIHDTVTSADITDGTIVAGDIATSAVTTTKILDGTILAADIATGAITTVEILDGTILSADIAEGILRVDTVTVTNPQIEALHSSPKEIVAAQGADTVIQFLSALLFYNYDIASYSTCGYDMTINYTDGSGAAVSSALSGTGFLTAENDVTAIVLPVAVATTSAAGIENQALVLSIATQDPNDGDGDNAAGTLSVTVSYRVITTP